MKVIKAIFLTLCILIVLIVVGALIAVKTVDINKFRDQISSAVSAQVKKDVRLEKISYSFSLSKGAMLMLEGIEIGNLQKLEDYALKAGIAALDVDLWELITARKLNIKSIRLKDPLIKAVYQSKPSEGGEPDSASGKAETVKPAAAAGIPKISDFVDEESLARAESVLIERIEIENGRLELVDNSGAAPKILVIDRLNVLLKDVALGDPFEFDARMAIFSDRENVKIDGKIQVDKDSYRLTDARMETDLAKLQLDAVNKWAPVREHLDASHKVMGLFEAALDDASFSGKGMAFKGNARMTDGEIKLLALDQVLDNIDFRVEFNEKEIIVPEVFLYIFQGRTVAKAEVKNYLSKPEFSAQLTIEDVSLAEMAKKYKLPAAVEGKLYGKFIQDGRGTAPEEIIESLTGKVEFRVEGGKIVDFNVLRYVMEKIAFIPGVAQVLEEKLSRYNKERLALKDTEFENVSLNLLIEKDNIAIQNITAGTKEFLYDISGVFDKKLNGTIRSKLVLANPISMDMVAAVPEFKYLQNEEKQIVINMADYTGNILQYKPNPLNVDIPIQVIRSKAEEEAKKALQKYLKIPQPDGAQPDSTQPVPDGPSSENPQGTPGSQQPESLEDVLIDNAMDLIFGK